MAYPMAFFPIFYDRMCGLEYRFTHFKQGIRHFFFFFIVFLLFLPIFRKQLFGPFTPFYAPTWITPHHLWPILVPPHPLSLTKLKMTLRIKKPTIFEFFKRCLFWPFLAIWGSGDPLRDARLGMWGVWEVF